MHIHKQSFMSTLGPLSWFGFIQTLRAQPGVPEPDCPGIPHVPQHKHVGSGSVKSLTSA